VARHPGSARLMRISPSSYHTVPPFLYHVTKGGAQPGRVIRLAVGRPRPHVEGVRVGGALGLRHEDIDVGGCLVNVVARENADGARAKGWRLRIIPEGAALMRLCAGYLNREYLAMDCDCVFVSLRGGQFGRPLRYRAVYGVVVRLREKTGVEFSPHSFRTHTPGGCHERRGDGASKNSSATPRSPLQLHAAASYQPAPRRLSLPAAGHQHRLNLRHRTSHPIVVSVTPALHHASEVTGWRRRRDDGRQPAGHRCTN
jgi:hypothetical protein